MFNNRTFSLEDNAQLMAPDAQAPVICDHCEQMQRGIGRYWSSWHALKRSTHHYQVQDFEGAGTQECSCCHTRAWMGRHRVELVRKAA